MPKAFKFLPVAENEGPISLHPVHGKTHQVQDRWCSGLQSCAEVSLSKRQHMTTLEILEMASETVEVRKNPKLTRREQAWWAMDHVLEDLVGEQAWLRESAEWQEALMEELMSNTKVI